jgi:ParB-like chromosome segregation protein Spo0J
MVHPSLLRPNTYNTNAVGPENEARLKASVQRLGLFKPIIVRTSPDATTTYEILGGEHRWRDAVEEGVKEVPIFDLGEIDDQKAKEISIADNARYGVDDTVELAKLLKELGGAESVQEFLPYSDAELNSIFSTSDIVLDELDLAENFAEKSEDTPAEPAAAKAAKTHTIMRFKVSLGDAEALTKLIARTQKRQGFTGSDELTNAGDALVHLLSGNSEEEDA